MKYAIAAVLKKDNPFYDIFPGGIVPLVSAETADVGLIGNGETKVYFVSWPNLNRQQRHRVAAVMIQLRGGDEMEFMHRMETGDFLPLRANQVESVAIDSRFFV